MVSWRLLLALAVARQLTATAGSCPEGAKPFPSSFKGKGKINYANLFEISYHDTYKVVTHSPTLSKYQAHPDDSLKGQDIPQLVLYQCGTARPSGSDPGITSSGIRYFEIPVQRVTLGTGGPLPFMELLSVTEAISLIDLTSISSPCAQLLEECIPGVHISALKDSLGWEGNASTTDVAFSDSWGTGYGGTPEKDVPVQISRDPGILNRAEWIRFVAAFFNEEVKADEIFSRIDTDYKALRFLGQALSTDESTEWGGRVPQVIWVTTAWSGGFEITNSHWKGDLTRHAGAKLVPMPAEAPAGCNFNDNSDGSKTMVCSDTSDGRASFHSFLSQADAIIDEQYIVGFKTAGYDFAATYKVPEAGDIPALARDPINIFQLDGTISDTEGAEGEVGTAWFDLMPSQPQQLLADLMEAIWTGSFDSPCGMKFLRRAVPGQGQTVLGDDNCPYHDDDGNHDCAAIHDHKHESPKCSPIDLPTATTTTVTTTATTTTAVEVDGAPGLPITSAFAAAAAFCSL